MANKSDWVPVKQFVKIYVKVSQADGTAVDVGEQLGLKSQTVTRRAASLRKRGVELPLLRKSESTSMLDQAKEALAEALGETADIF
jgi:DNA-binding MarR family transcriptional regulator